MSAIKKKITNRLYLISFILIVIIFSIVFKIIELQFFKGDYYIGISEKREFKNIEIPAKRGNIYSDSGELLASSVSRYNIRFDALAPNDKNFNKYVKLLSAELSVFDGKSVEWHEDKLRKARKDKNRYLKIASNLGVSDYEKFKNFPLFKLGNIQGGFISVSFTTREYPIGGIAERTIGYERVDEKGNVTRVGLDGFFGKKYLKGQNGIRFSQKISNNNWKPMLDYNVKDPVDGFDIYTTLNIEIQDFAHHALLKQLEFFEAEHGSVVVMETKTGNIKAISNLGRTTNGKYYEKLNYAVGESHEPGSTFKLMSIVKALEDRVVDTSDIIDTKNGKLTIHSKEVSDSKIGGYGKISVAKAFEVSSNTAFVKIINQNYKNNPELFIDGLFGMKVNQKLDIPILGEGKPKFTHPKDKLNWDGLDLPWMSFGYGISMTPLQTLTFYNAIANDGIMVKPKFIDHVKQFDKTIEKFETEVISNSICSIETVNKVKNLMKNVVEKEHGTANNIYTKDVSMAGKTGTCQTEYWKSKGLYISSFAGYFPAENPKYSCIVVIHKPNKEKGYYGSVVAAPVFKEIAQKIYSDSPKIETYKEMKLQIHNNRISDDIISKLDSMIMPDISECELIDIIPLLENAGWQVLVEGSGHRILQSVEAGAKLEKGQIIKIRLI